jgi:hypothetical protein
MCPPSKRDVFALPTQPKPAFTWESVLQRFLQTTLRLAGTVALEERRVRQQRDQILAVALELHAAHLGVDALRRTTIKRAVVIAGAEGLIDMRI